MATTELKVRDVMTREPVTCETSTPIEEAARLMRDRDIGDVLVCEADVLRGIVTDRDIVVRCIAGSADIARARLGDVCTGDLLTVTPDTSLDDAARVMRDGAVRRVPVMEDGRAVGIVSLGDLAVEIGGRDGRTDRDPGAVLAGISAAEPNV